MAWKDHKVETIGSMEKVVRYNAILRTSWLVLRLILAIIALAVVAFLAEKFSLAFRPSDGDGLAFLFIGLLVIPGLPWNMLDAHLYPGAAAPTNFFLSFMTGFVVPAFFNAILIGGAIEWGSRVRARRAGQPVRIWTRGESGATWLVMAVVLSVFGYSNWWSWQSSLAWRKAHPHAAYRLSHPAAQRQYMEKMHRREMARWKRQQLAIRRRTQTALRAGNPGSMGANAEPKAAPPISPWRLALIPGQIWHPTVVTPPPRRLATLQFRLGEPLSDVNIEMKHLALPQIGQRVIQSFVPSIGLWLFFDEKESVREIRLQAPFVGPVHGIKIGNSLAKLIATLGTPTTQPFPFAGNTAYVYRSTNIAYRFDVGGPDSLVRDIFIIEEPENKIGDNQPVPSPLLGRTN